MHWSPILQQERNEQVMVGLNDVGHLFLALTTNMVFEARLSHHQLLSGILLEKRELSQSVKPGGGIAFLQRVQPFTKASVLLAPALCRVGLVRYYHIRKMHLKTTFQISLVQSIRRLFLLCVLALLPAVSVLVEQSSAVYAMNASANISVVIATDATNLGGPCTESLGSTHIPCPAGTVIGSKVIHLAEAIAQHEPYAVWPSTSATQITWQRMRIQLFRVMQEKGQKFLQSSKKTNILPLIACGTTSTLQPPFVVSWHPFGDGSMTSREQFYKTSDCKNVTLETASIVVNTPCQFNACYWDHDQYQGGWFGAGYPCLCQRTTYSHSVDQNWTPGYYYETWLYDGQYYTYVNIGPIQ